MRRRAVLAGLGATALGGQWAMAQNTSLYVPPEEAPHASTFMMWPVSRRVHPDAEFLDLLQGTIADIANAISDFEPVVMLAAKSDHARARAYLGGSIELWDVPTEDLWARDAGPNSGAGMTSC